MKLLGNVNQKLCNQQAFSFCSNANDISNNSAKFAFLTEFPDMTARVEGKPVVM